MTFFWPCSNLGIAHPTGETAQSREQALIFKTLGQFTRGGLPYSTMKERFDMSGHQVETRVALFQELGLLYNLRGQDRLRLTNVGGQLLDLLIATRKFREREAEQATALVAWALSNIEIRRPVSPGSPPLTLEERAACDIRPCAGAWSLMLDLGGILYMHEFLGPVRRLRRAADYDACVEGLLAARKLGRIFVDRSEWASGAPLMNPSIYWKSRLSVAGQMLTYDGAAHRFTFAPGGENLVLSILEAQEADESGDMPFRATTASPDIADYFANAGRACPASVAGMFVEDIPSGLPSESGAGQAWPEPTPAPPGRTSSAEGQRQFRRQHRIERSSWLSREAKRLNAEQQGHAGRITCESCGFSHTDAAMLDAHHEHPLAAGVRQTRVEDLRILCPLCHRRAHRNEDRLMPFSVDELRAWVEAGRP